MNAKPELHYTIFVDLTPDVEDREDERGAEDHEPEEERDDYKTDGVEDQHKEIVSWPTTKVTWIIVIVKREFVMVKFDLYNRNNL